MPVKSTIEVPLGDEIVQCTVSLPATLGRVKIADFTSRFSAAVLSIANEVDPQTAPSNDPSDPISIEQGDGSANGVPPRDTIDIEFRGTDGHSAWYRLKRATELQRAMDSYAERKGRECNDLSFVFDGQRVSGDDTPLILEMETGDTIDVFPVQRGS